MELTTGFAVTSLYAALLGIMLIPFTLRVGLYRVKNGINLGDGQDEEMIRRIRAHANFTEFVPIALILLGLVEVAGASSILVHALGAALTLGRLSHWLQLSGLVKPLAFRAGGMLATLLTILISSVWLIVHTLM